MNLKLTRLFALVLLSLVLALSSAWALTPEVQSLVGYETRANAIASRSDKMVPIEHYEIPLRILQYDLSSRIPADVRDALIFEKNGEMHVRWIINPEDTKWHKEMEEFLKKNGVEPKRFQHFQGYQTASRSYIVESPDTKAQFSLKVSTNKTGGNWTDKKQTAEDALEVRKSTDYVLEEGRRRPYENFVVMDEPLAFGAKEIDQGMLVRTLNDLPKGGKVYLPGFSAMHEDVGKKIAALNGFTNPAEFWNQHYNKPLARALAELAARTGVAYDSPHSQNFLIELDENYKPTGKVVLRDLGDIYLTPEIARARGYTELADLWPKENLTSGRISASVGIMHGNNLPSWLSESDYSKWGQEFYEVYEKEFARVSGLPGKGVFDNFYQNGRYFTKTTSLDTPEWKSYLDRIAEERERWAAELLMNGGKIDCGRLYGRLN